MVTLVNSATAPTLSSLLTVSCPVLWSRVLRSGWRHRLHVSAAQDSTIAVTAEKS